MASGGNFGAGTVIGGGAGGIFPRGGAGGGNATGLEAAAASVYPVYIG